MNSSTGMTSRFEYSSSHIPIIKPCCDPFSPCDFTEYEFMARTYLQSKESLLPSIHVASLSLGFKDPLVRDWFMADMPRLCSLTLTDFLSELRAAFLPRDWDRKMKDSILSTYQGVDEPAIVWITRLRSKNTFIRNTPHHLSNHELLAHFKSHLNNHLSSIHRRDADAPGEDDLMQWILLIRCLDETADDADRDSESDVTATTPVSAIPTDPRLRKRDEGLSPKRAPTTTPPLPPSPVSRMNGVPKSPCLSPPPPPPPSASPRPLHLRVQSRSLPDRPKFDPYTSSIPSLTNEQRHFLRSRQGCFRCRRIGVRHAGGECLYGEPSPANYRGIMLPDGVGLVRDAPRHHLSERGPSMLNDSDDAHGDRRGKYERV
ncbi:hypothetical protein IW261DRAFT_1114091 [Armillaria novae-zelandiae]|uniref:Retrotransposon gag domain-containing protein n=1 Tax=Armillaria novae-zelandiae TaxID=153914 RepID=A0AA39NJ63_9AGAR|nr:hypothetical protein IW261DRAFT_1114091 [Armillaria novae-zelandiae]